LVGGLAAGCSAGNLTDGLTTSSTAPVTVAQANQPYPGDVRVVRPKAEVGGGGFSQSAAPVSPLPPPSTPAASTYAAPVSSGTISSSTLPPPSGSQNAAPAYSAPSPQQAAAPVQPDRRPVEQAAVTSLPKQQATRQDRASGGTYTVASGDTLYGIARKTGVSVAALKQANALPADGSIRIGQKLSIPGASTVAAAAPAKAAQPVKASLPAVKPSAKPAAAPVTVAENKPKSEPAEEAPRVTAYQPPVESKPKAVEAVDQTEVAALPPESTGVGRLRWPAQGRVISGFGSNGGSRNDGIDIAVPAGTSVHAAENGVVIYAGDGLKGFGNTVLVRHEDGLVTVYGHASDLKVKRGDKVRRGQEIALSGMTGDADRPKLHFEVRKGTTPVDPMTYLQ